MATDPALCICTECRALDARFPNEGRQWALVDARPPHPVPPSSPIGGGAGTAGAAGPRHAYALSWRGPSPSTPPVQEKTCRRFPMSVITMTIADLCVSPFNCRTNTIDANAVNGMADSLASRWGQLNPLVVHPLPKGRGRSKKALYGVLAGGRRYRAFVQLIEQGRLPADHPIEVIVRDISDEGELRELSLAENLVRVDLRPYEKYAAVARAHAAGRPLQDIADTNGQPLETVRRWVRLGNLHPEIFAALEQGRLSEEQARAFAATEDQVLQAHVFAQCSSAAGDVIGSPAAIRRQLKVGDAALAQHLAFVGEAAYAAAGGRYELDLFADAADHRGRVVDEGLLMQLVEAKLEAARERLRAQLARHDADAGVTARTLRFEPEAPRNAEYGGVAHDLEIRVEPRPASADDAQRLAWIGWRMAELEAQAEDVLDALDALDADELDQDIAERLIAHIDDDYGPLEDERAALEQAMELPLPTGDIFATLDIETDGALEIRYWWASRKEKRRAQSAIHRAAQGEGDPVSLGPIPKDQADAAARALMPRPAPGGGAIDNSYGYAERQKADAAIRDDHGFTAEGVQVLRALRREVLRCALLDDSDGGGDVAHDYAIWALLRFELTGGFGFQLGARRLGPAYEGNATVWGSVRPHLKRAIAGQRWEKEMASLRDHASMALKDLPAAFLAFHHEPSLWKNHAAALLAGLMLERSLEAPGYQVALHDVLADRVGLTDDSIALYAEPDEELLATLPRAHRLALVRPHVPAAEYAALEKAKAADLTAPVARALRRARHWVHPLLRFARPAPTPTSTPAAPQPEMLEAAE